MSLYASRILLLNSDVAFCFSELCFAFSRFEILLCKNAFRILLCNYAFECCFSILLSNYALQFCYAILRLNYFVILSLMCSLYVTYGSIKVGHDVFQNPTISNNEIVAFVFFCHVWLAESLQSCIICKIALFRKMK